MKVLANLEFKNSSTYILSKFNEFPENPVPGMMAFLESGLYIYTDDLITGELKWINLIDLTRTNTSYTHKQETASIEWTVAHNLNSEDLFAIIYDSNGQKQIESEQVFVDDNTIKLIFSEPISGKALVFGASVLASPSNVYTREQIDYMLQNVDNVYTKEEIDKMLKDVAAEATMVMPEGGVDGDFLVKDSQDATGLGWVNIDEKVQEAVDNAELILNTQSALNMKILVPENTTFPYNQDNHIVCADLPISVGLSKQITLTSPFGNTPCIAEILFKNSSGTWSANDVIYSSGTYGSMASCPGDGNVYITTGNKNVLWGSSGGTAPTSSALSATEVVVVLYAPTTEIAKGDPGKDGSSILTHGTIDWNTHELVPFTHTTENSIYYRTLTAPNSGVIAADLTIGTAGAGSYITIEINDNLIERYHPLTGQNIKLIPVNSNDILKIGSNIAYTATTFTFYPYKNDGDLLAKLSSLTIGEVTQGDTPQVINSGTVTDPILDFVLPKTSEFATMDMAILVPEGTTFEFCKDKQVVSPNLPLSPARSSNFVLDSPFGENWCYAECLAKHPNTGKWFKVDATYSSSNSITGNVVACPGDGFVYLTTAVYAAWSNHGLTAPATALTISATELVIILMCPKLNTVPFGSISSLTIGKVNHSEDAVTSIVNVGTASDPVLNFTLKDGKDGHSILTHNVINYENQIEYTVDEVIEELISSIYYRTVTSKGNGFMQIDMSVGTAGVGSYWIATINDYVVYRSPLHTGQNIIQIPVQKDDIVKIASNLAITGITFRFRPYREDESLFSTLTSFKIGTVEHGEDKVPSVTNSGTLTNPVLNFTLKDGKDGLSVLTHGALDYENEIIYTLSDVVESVANNIYSKKVIAKANGMMQVDLTTSTSTVAHWWEITVNGYKVHRAGIHTGQNVAQVHVSIDDEIILSHSLVDTAYTFRLRPYKEDSELIGKLSSFSIGSVTSGPDVVPSVTNSGTTENPVLNFNLKDGVGKSIFTHGRIDYENAVHYTNEEITEELIDNVYWKTVTANDNGYIKLDFTVGTSTVAHYWMVTINDEYVFRHPLHTGQNITQFPVEKGQVIKIGSTLNPTTYTITMRPYTEDLELVGKMSSLTIGEVTHSVDATPGIVNVGSLDNPILNFTLKDGEPGKSVYSHGNIDWENPTELAYVSTTENSIYYDTVEIPKNGVLHVIYTASAGSYFTSYQNDVFLERHYASVNENRHMIHRLNEGDVIKMGCTVKQTSQVYRFYPYKEDSELIGKLSNFQIGTVTHGVDETPGVTNSGTTENPVLNFTLKDGRDAIAVLTHGNIDDENIHDLEKTTVTTASPFTYNFTADANGLVQIQILTTTSAVGSYLQVQVNGINRVFAHVRTGDNIFDTPVKAHDEIIVITNVGHTTLQARMLPYKNDMVLISELSSLTIGSVKAGPDETTGVVNSGTMSDPILDFTIKDGRSVLTHNVPNYYVGYTLDAVSSTESSVYYYTVTIPESGLLNVNITIGTAAANSYWRGYVITSTPDEIAYPIFLEHLRSAANIRQIPVEAGTKIKIGSNIAITAATFTMYPFKNDETLMSAITSLKIGECTTNDDNLFTVTNTGTAQDPVLNFSLPKVIKHEGTEAPSDTLGEDGDFYFQYA